MSTEVEQPSAKPSPSDDEPPPSEPAATTVPAADVARSHLKGLLEALVFVSEHPLSVGDLAKAAGGADKKLVRALVEELSQEYSRRGIHLEEVAGGILFRTSAAYAPFIRDAVGKKPVRMTRAQLETLAIVAYRQPLTRPEIDDIRGVDSGPVLKILLDRDLVKILGKKDEPGRPLLYGTTPSFLEFFGLKALKDLPNLREFTELSDDSRRVYDREMSASDETAADLGTLAAAASAVASDNEDASERTDPSLSVIAPADDSVSEPPGSPREVDSLGVEPASPEDDSESDPAASPEDESADAHDETTDPDSADGPTDTETSR